MRRLAAIVFVCLALAPSVGRAVEPDELLADPVLESRARALSSGLRCMVCQNQSIDDSHADLARDLRILVRERLKAGDSDQAIRDALVARYGDFVLLKPPFDAQTALLWLLPFGLLGVGGVGLLLGRRRAGRPQPVAPLTGSEQAAIDRLLHSGPG